MISSLSTNLCQHVGTSRGGTMVQLHQAISQRLGFLPAVSFEELLSFASRLKPRFGLLAVEQRWSVALGYPVSEIKLRQKEHDRDTTFAGDLFEQAKSLPGVCDHKGFTCLFDTAPRVRITKRMRHVEQQFLRLLTDRKPIVTGEYDKCVRFEVQRLSDQLLELVVQEIGASQIHNFDFGRSAGSVHYLLQRLRRCEVRIVKMSSRHRLADQHYATA